MGTQIQPASLILEATLDINGRLSLLNSSLAQVHSQLPSFVQSRAKMLCSGCSLLARSSMPLLARIESLVTAIDLKPNTFIADHPVLCN